ncbi:Peripheral plasma membrane protein CASK [Acropora cervicornis]|uniref:Peripheral plasma membrane protein CASK n=1 Tax=Acropora cervicornis TaxID=6130 RepID=A0AAD9R5L4_ACRCE|nr:Peripheral plasma membrane protein CASK [Acropora cervicornis]
MDKVFPSWFELQEQIGKGTFSVIRRCLDKRGDRVCAVKIVDITKMSSSSGLTEEDLQREACICQKLRHPHIVEMLGAYSMDGFIYMVFEYMDGADLCFEIVNRVNAGFVYSEAVASHYLRQPHNILLASKENSAPIKIADFGVAMEIGEEGYITSGRIGTPHFMSPEMINREQYGKPIDVWGCGVVLFILLSGSFPFQGTGEKLYESIRRGVPTMRPKMWDNISDEARDLVKKMLEHDQNVRVTAREALQHPWLKNREVPQRMHLQESVDEMKKFNARRKLKWQMEMSLGAIGQLLDSLEEIQVLTGAKTDDVNFLQSLFENHTLQALLEVYDRSQEWTEENRSFPTTSSDSSAAVQDAKEVIELIDYKAEDDDDCYELQNILSDPHVAALLQAHDEVLKNASVEDANTYPTDNDTSFNDRPAEDSVGERTEKLTRVRLVQFHKQLNEPMGITLKLNEEGRCTLHPGDEIREINGINVADKSVENLQALLVYVRALFDYDPRGDDLIPCQQAGLAFSRGDIIQVVSKADPYWWQAMKTNDSSRFAGLAPSPELQEWRLSCLAAEKSRKQNGATCLWFGKKKKIFDQLELVTYEEVVKLDYFKRKTLVLLGAHGVGRRHIKNTLINKYPGRFSYPIPHTTREPKDGEEDGKNYLFVSAEDMLADVEAKKYLEYGTHQGAMYGTKLDTIRDNLNQGLTAILDVEPQALKVLRSSEFSPYVVFISAPTIIGNDSSTIPYTPNGDVADESLQRLAEESETLRKNHGHLFDLTIVNNDIDDTIRLLETSFEQLHVSPQWVPVSWVY